MAIFPKLELEETVQIADTTRLDASKSFVTNPNNPITKIEIQPEALGNYIDVTDVGYLDWEYAASGVKAVSVRITATEASASGVSEKSISVVTEEADYLFSRDSDLQLHEPDILKWMRPGRTTYKDMHRRAQTIIMGWLDREGYVTANRNKYTKTDIKDIEEVRQISIYTTLRLIFNGISNAIDDIFKDKAKMYGALEEEWKRKAVLRLDTDEDGTVDTDEGLDLGSCFVARR